MTYETTSSMMAALAEDGPVRITPQFSGVCAPAPSMPWPDFLCGQEAKPVQVLLVEDDPYVRRVISQELLSDLRIQLLAQGSSLREGMRLVSQHAFDVLMVDLRLGDGSGFDLIEEARRVRPDCEIIVISSVEDDHQVLRALELGASGYLIKNASFQNFVQAVLQVVNGGAPISPRLARRLLTRLDTPKSEALPTSTGRREARLSQREREVLGLVASGNVSSEIGTKLGISTQTVNVHVKNIYKKLQVHSRAQAVSYATEHGMI